MLTLTTHSGLKRRDFLTLGSLGLGGLTLSSLLGGRLAAAQSPQLVTGRSVIYLFLQGGPSQFETFDPKPDLPDSQRTVTGITETSLPGVWFGAKLPQLARLADKLTIVRSFQTNNGGHNIQPIVSADSLQANIGCLYSRVVGATRPDTGMPTNSVVFADAVDSKVLKGKARGDLAATGAMGASHAPFIPGANGQLQRNLKLNLPADRLADRAELAAQIDTLTQQIEDESLDHLQKQAYQVLLSGGVAKALDLSLEDAATVERYDTAAYVRPDGWRQAKRGQAGMYTGHAKALGKQLLLARRLCEAGCGFVTIHDGYDGVWDWHGDGNNLGAIDGAEACIPPLDHAVAAFIEDCEARGLSDKILLVIGGEMGRTPKLNTRGGRDHWAKLSPLLLYGGGLPAGRVIGQSNRDGGEPAVDACNPKHLISTILRSLFDAGKLRLEPEFSAVSKLAEHPPIPIA
jgi:hypothetical protein